MNEGKLNIDDMTALHITLGHGPDGWVLNMSALGHGSTHLGVESPETIQQAVTDQIRAYLDKMTTILADRVTPRT